MRKVKIGVIGCGVISQIYLSNITEMYHWLEVAACADMFVEKAKASAEKFGIPKACTVEELLADPEIEMVLNLTIPAVHAQVNKQVLLAGKHVFCEKPLALSLEDANELISIAKEKGLMLGCAPDTFLGAGLQTCRKIIDEGWIGKPVSATANMINHGPETWHAAPEFYYKAGGGPLLDMGPYYLTALVTLLGPIENVSCFANRAMDTRMIYSEPLKGKMMTVDVPTHYAGTLEFKNGAVANINMSFDIWRSHLPKLEIYGTEGTLVLPDPNMFGGQIQIFRGESILENLGSGLPAGNDDINGASEYYKEFAQVYPQPRENMRGMGILDMAFALVEGREHRASAELAYHVTEAMLGMEKAAADRTLYHMTSTCSRPKPIPMSMPVGELD